MDFTKMTKEEIAAKLAEFKQLEKEVKAARKSGLIPKAEKKSQVVKSPEYTLLTSQFVAVIQQNLDYIKKQFNATVTTEKPLGNIGIQFTEDGFEYSIQIISNTVRKAKVDAKPKPVKTETTAIEHDTPETPA